MKYAIVTIIGMVVIAGCVTLHCMDTPEKPETPPATEEIYTEDIVVVIPEKTLVKGKYQRETDRPIRRWMKTGMPCDLYQGESDEQETSEEESNAGVPLVCQDETPTLPHDSVYLQVSEEEWNGAGGVQQTMAHETETVGQAEYNQTQGAVVEAVPTGCDRNNLEQFLKTLLVDLGYEFFYPYAWCQIQQESHWNPTAVSPDGLDFGILQYRAMYWSEPESIMDPYAQIRKYVSQVSARIAAGLSVEEVISRHITSDYVTEINWEYVNLVLSHMN